MIPVKVQKLKPTARIPQYALAGDACVDLHACLDEPIILRHGERAKVGTGIAIAMPAGYEGLVRPRSGAAVDKGFTVLNAPGTIDNTFRGEICVIIVNLGGHPHSIEDGDRIAQLAVRQYPEVDFIETEHLMETARGARGFGSTGQRDEMSSGRFQRNKSVHPTESSGYIDTIEQLAKSPDEDRRPFNLDRDGRTKLGDAVRGKKPYPGPGQPGQS